MSIELKHLRYTEVADRYGSFRKAAASLALNQAVDARRSRRGIQPHYLLLCSRIWYVPIWDESRGNSRTFCCDRIMAPLRLRNRV
ncbi:MAG: WYL domain-containing protein [Methylocystis sp.]